MAVDRDYGLLDVVHVLADAADEPSELLRGGIAHSIGNVDSRRARHDHGLQHFVQVLRIRPRRVHGRELHVLHIATRARHHLHGALQGFLSGQPELVLEVDVRRRDEGMDADLGRALQGFPGAVDVLRARAGKATDRGALHFLRDAPHSLEIARRAVRKASLDDVHAEPGQLLGHHQLLVGIHRRAGRLLAVPERRVEDTDQTTHLKIPTTPPLTYPLPRGERGGVRGVPVPGCDGPSGASG